MDMHVSYTHTYMYLISLIIFIYDIYSFYNLLVTCNIESFSKILQILLLKKTAIKIT